MPHQPVPFEIDSSLERRMLARIQFGAPSGCWLWAGSITGGEYGGIPPSVGHTMVLAHRAAYVLWNGPIPDGLCVLHRCDTPLCVNPAHLFAGTNRENAKDREDKGRGVRKLGEAHGRAIFTEEDIRLIRKSTRSNAGLGRIYGVPRQTIRGISLGETWRHVR